MSTDDVAQVAAGVRRAPPRAGTTKVVAVDGRSGAGKSTFARHLGHELAAPIVDLELIYPGWDGLERGIDLLISDVLVPLATGKEASVPRWDYAADGWGTPVTLAPADVVVVEGVGVGAQRVMEYVSLLVWVELDEATRYARAMGRDADLYRPHWRRWASQEERLLSRENTPARADYVVSVTGSAPGPR